MMEREFHFFVEPEICSADSEGSDDAEGSEGSGSGEFEDFFDGADKAEGRSLIVRLDKWLWAARFFKTRALARAAVEAGKIYYNGERSKPSREIEVGAILQIRHGRFEKTIIVKGLSTRRRSTDEALQLFEETEESKSLRELQTADYSQHYQHHHQQQHHHHQGNQHNQSNGEYYNSHYQEQSSFAHQQLSQGSQGQKPMHYLRRGAMRAEPRQEIRSPYGVAKQQRTPRTGGHEQVGQYRQPHSGYPPYPNQNHGHHHSNHTHTNHHNHAGHQPNAYQQPGYHHSSQQPDNYNNPVYNNNRPYNGHQRQTSHHSPNSHGTHYSHHAPHSQNSHNSQHSHHSHDSNPYNHSRQSHTHPNYQHAVPGNKTEPQTELD